MWSFLLLGLADACSNTDSDRISALESENEKFLERFDSLEAAIANLEASNNELREQLDCGDGLAVCGCPANQVVAPEWTSKKCIEASSRCPTSNFDEWRLPKTVMPSHYELNFNFGGLKAADMVNNRFVYHGSSVIYADATDSVCQIIVHTNFDTVVIKSAHLSIKDSNVEIFVDQNEEKQYLRITPEYPIPSGESLKLEFTFMVNVPTNSESLDGLYSSYYDDDAGNRNYLLTTQFEAWGARMAFPCFDEPAFKSTFDVKMSYKPYGVYSALFNTEVKETSEFEGVRTDIFHTTMQISPYLLAIVVSSRV